MGVAEVLARLPSIQRARGALHQSLLAEGADAALLVDAPDLHLPMAAQARRRPPSDWTMTLRARRWHGPTATATSASS